MKIETVFQGHTSKHYKQMIVLKNGAGEYNVSCDIKNIIVRNTKANITLVHTEILQFKLPLSIQCHVICDVMWHVLFVLTEVLTFTKGGRAIKIYDANTGKAKHIMRPPQDLIDKHRRMDANLYVSLTNTEYQRKSLCKSHKHRRMDANRYVSSIEKHRRMDANMYLSKSHREAQTYGHKSLGKFHREA